MKPDYRKQLDKVIHDVRERRSRYRDENLKLTLQVEKEKKHGKNIRAYATSRAIAEKFLR